MKFKIILLLTALMLSCQTNKSMNSDDRINLDFLTIISENKIDRELEDWQQEKLNKLLTFGYSASDILSYSNNNLFATLELEKSKEEAQSGAEKILNNIWDIYTKDEYIKELKILLLEGMRKRYIDILNLILGKKELLNDPNLLLQYETWETEIETGLITVDDYKKIAFIIQNREYISYRDIYLLELERISIFTRWGYAMDYLTKDQANYIIEDVALEMSEFDISWLDWGSSYIAGLTMLWYDSQKISYNIRNRALTVQRIVNKLIWSKSDLKDLPKLAKELKDDKISKDPEIFKFTIQPPKLPTSIDVAPEIALLFDYERKSKNLATFYEDEYELQEAIRDKNFNKAESILTTKREHIYDVQLNIGLSYVSFAVEKKEKKIVKLLLDLGFNPNLPNTGGNKRTSLYYAVENRDIEIVTMLLEAGADPNIKLKNGNTALIKALQNNDTEIEKLLYMYGTDPYIEDTQYLGSWSIKVKKHIKVYVFYKNRYEFHMISNHPGVSKENHMKVYGDGYISSTESTVRIKMEEGLLSFIGNKYTFIPTHVRYKEGYTLLSQEQQKRSTDTGELSLKDDKLFLNSHKYRGDTIILTRN